ncbi:MAG: undecaprenyl diphosphate synthase family protein, partial [Planctomycetota bacterium]|nr:undecaprenyl diphosphate synthase family protein [Planctomycetota bacterium]
HAAEAARCKLRPSDITPERLQAQLLSRDLPPVDLLVRTGGVGRISDFLLWQAGYAELFFADVPWCDFRRDHLRAALADYARRRRTFGALPGKA